MSPNLQMVEFMVKISSGLLSGSDLHMLLIEYPSMMACTTKIDHFQKMSMKAGAFQLLAKTMTILGSGAMFYYRRERKYLYVASLTVSMILYSPLILGPINTALHESKNAKESDKNTSLLIKWRNYCILPTLVDTLAFAALLF